MEENNEINTRLKYFFLGGIAGMAVTILFAPQSGKKTREMIGEKATESKEALNRGVKNVGDKAVGTAEKVASEGRSFVGKGKNTIDKEKEILAAAVEAGIQAYREQREASEEKHA